MTDAFGCSVADRELSQVQNILPQHRQPLQFTTFFKKAGFWLLDVELLVIVSAYVSGIWEYVTNQSGLTILRIVLFVVFVGITAFAIFTFYLFLRHYGMLIGHQKETSVDIYSPDNLPKLQKTLSQAKHEILLLGIALEGLNHVMPSIETLLRNRRRVRVLVGDPNSPLICEMENVVISTDTGSRITSTLSMLNKMRDTLGDNRNNLQIRTHRRIPTHSMIIIDPVSNAGFMQVEPYPFHGPQQDRRIFRITQSDQHDLFEVYRSSYENL